MQTLEASKVNQVYGNIQKCCIFHIDLDVTVYLLVCKSNTFQQLYEIWTKNLGELRMDEKLEGAF